MHAVIIAGGKGRRLQPFTTTIPKPLFPLGEKPIIQIIIEQLREAGIRDFIVSVGYLGELVEAYLGSGKKFGCSIEYVREPAPLGTAGSISLLPEMHDDFIFMNGDVFASIDFPALVAAHKASRAMMTVCTYRKHVKSSLGVLDVDADGRVTDYREKPEQTHIVSSGVYVMNPAVRTFVPPGTRMDLPDLVLRLIRDHQVVRAVPIDGFWFDIGTPEDLENALKFYEARNA
jgi:NDP-sugar pyrophosphorylase family protein